MRIVRTPRGLRVLQGGVVLSEVLDRPGATHTLFDVLAACIAALAPGPRAALLGFAAGGVVAPLRAMGWAHPLEAVDLDVEGEVLFRHLSGAWAGEVRVAKGDAVEWIRRRGRPFDLVLEDLSVPTPQGVTKPAASLASLPPLVARRLGTRGVFAANLLPIPGVPWREAVDRVSAPWPRAALVHLDEYENRIVLAGRRLPSARALSRRLRAALAGVGSGQAHLLSVRRWKGGGR